MFGKLLKGIGGALGGGAKSAGKAMTGMGGAIRDANAGPGPWGGLGKRKAGGGPLAGAGAAGAAVGEAMGGGERAPSGNLGTGRDAGSGIVEGPTNRRIMGMPVGRSPVLDAVKAGAPMLSKAMGGMFGKRNKRKKTVRGGKR